MNIFDIFAAIALLWAIISGWRNGLVSQIFSIAGIIAGAFIAYYAGGRVGAMLGVDEKLAYIVGFITTFVSVLILAAIASKLLRTLFSAIGLGSLDTLLGILLSMVKCTFVLCVLFAAIEALDKRVDILGSRHFEQSHTFRPIRTISKSVTDFLEQLSKEEETGV